MQRHPPAHPSKRLPPRLRRLRRYFVQSFRKLASALRQQHSARVQLIGGLRSRQHHFGKRALFLELPRAFRASRQVRLNALAFRFRHFIPDIEDQQRRDFAATLLFRPAHRSTPSSLRSFRVARNSEFFTVSSVVPRASPIARSFSP